MDTPMFNTETDDVGGSETIVRKNRHKGPTSSQGRYTAVNGLAKSIVSKAQMSPDVFEFVMPIMRELFDKSVLLATKSVGLKRASKLVLDKKKIVLPRVPDKRKPSTEDVINHAHHVAKEEK